MGTGGGASGGGGGGGDGDGGRSFDEDDAETSFNATPEFRVGPPRRQGNVTLIHARASESAERDRVALGNSGSSRDPGLSGARLGSARLIPRGKRAGEREKEEERETTREGPGGEGEL